MRKAVCKTCKKVFSAPPKGSLPPHCPKHRYASTCKVCGISFNGKYRVEILCTNCRSSIRKCINCKEEFLPPKKGRISELCPKCRKEKQYKQASAFQKKETLRKNPVKTCIDCGGPVPLHKTTRYKRCETCDEKYKKRYEVSRRKRLKSEDPKFDKRRDLKKHYGMTLEDWDKLFAKQGKCCGICESPEPGGKGFWHVDHDHDTRKVRGILCNGCNIGLGHFKESIETLEKAKKYIRKHSK